MRSRSAFVRVLLLVLSATMVGCSCDDAATLSDAGHVESGLADTGPVGHDAGVRDGSLTPGEPGIEVVGTPPYITTERGGQNIMRVRLTAQPSSIVDVPVRPSDIREGVARPALVRFTNENWAAFQQVIVRGVDDDEADGTQEYQVVFGPTTSADERYEGLTTSITLFNTEDETPGITASEPTGDTSESGGQATFTLVLHAAPAGNVVLHLESSASGEGTVSPTSLTFTAANWNAPQTVTVTGVDDDVADGDQEYSITVASIESIDTGYSTLSPRPSVLLVNTDDETAGFVVTPISGDTTEAGGEATFTIALRSEPVADVTLEFASDDPTEGTTSTTSVTFTAINWNAPQVVTVRGVDDDVIDGTQTYGIVFSAPVSTDAAYAAITPPTVEVDNVDDETPGITVSPISGDTSEAGGEATFTVVLDSRPSSQVRLTIRTNDSQEGRVAPTAGDTIELVFTPENWNAPQTVTVTGIDDDVADGSQPFAVSFDAAVSSDTDYQGINVPDLIVINLDDDSAGISVSAPSGDTSEAGGEATFTVVLRSSPMANVTVSYASDDEGEGTSAPINLIFTPANWNAPQTVTVTGVDDAIADGNQPYHVVFGATTSTDVAYAAITPPRVTLTNVDDDSAGVTVSAISRNTTEAGGTATFTLVLTSEPSAPVTLSFASSDASEGVTMVTSATFTTMNWNAPQTITVTGVDDRVADGDQMYSVLFGVTTSTDTAYAAIVPTTVAVTNVDDDSAGITVSPISGDTTEAGGQATFTVVLRSEPSADVSLSLVSSDTTEGTVGPTTLTFTALNWNAPQTVTVTGVDDAVADGNQPYRVTFTPAVSADGQYSGLTATSVAVTNVDDDSAGVTVSAISGNTSEAGATATFTLVLRSEPTASVTLHFSSSDVGEGTTSASVTFTSLNWNAPQTVTVTGVDDAVADGNQPYSIVFGASTSADPAYAGLRPSTVSVINTDDDSAGITVSTISGNTTEAGGQASFTVVLTSEPTAPVVVHFDSSDRSEGTVAVTSLTFTTVNWNAPQRVDVTGVDDAIADGNQVYGTVFTATTSADAAYAAITPSAVTVTNVDDDSAGIVVSAISGNTTESGGTATFTVRLTSEPTSNVTVGFSSSRPSEGTTGVASLTFTPLNWASAQTVTVTGVDDAIADGNQLYAIVFATTMSADAEYAALRPGNLAVTNVDDDSAGFLVSAVSGNTTESGVTATFTVRLTSEPTSNVTLPFASSDTTEGASTSTSITFTASNWQTPQTITVRGVDDAVADGNQVYAVVFGATMASDAGYAAIRPSPVSLTNIDDDSAGFVVTVLDASSSEAGDGASFSVALQSEPTANVSLSFTSSDTTEGSLVVTSLTFTAANWFSPQTVTVAGVNDAIADGDIAYAIVFGATVSSDVAYAALRPSNVALTNIDDDIAVVTVSAISGHTTEAGGTATFTVVLGSEPTANVTVNFASNDATEGSTNGTSRTFTPSNWATPQTVVVTGVNDAIADGAITYAIVFSATTSADAVYAAITPSPVAVVNDDDEVAAVCHVVNGVRWCINPTACGEPCNAVCAYVGSTPAVDATVFAAQDSTVECQSIATAFGVGSTSLSSYTYGCVESNFGVHSVGTDLVAPLLCSTEPSCPAAHRTNMDSRGVACGPGSRRSICGCN